MPKAGKFLSIIILIAAMFLYFKGSKYFASSSAIPEKERIQILRDEISARASEAHRQIIKLNLQPEDSYSRTGLSNPFEKWQSLFMNPIGQPIPYQWRIDSEFGGKVDITEPKIKKFLLSTIDTIQKFNLRLVDLKPGGFMDIWSKNSNAFTDIVSKKKNGEYIFQETHLISSFKSPNFDKEKIFCLLQLNFNSNPNGHTSNHALILGHIKKISLLTETHPKYKGVRILFDLEKDHLLAVRLEKIDCFAPTSSEEDRRFMNLTTLDLSYAIGTPLLYQLLK